MMSHNTRAALLTILKPRAMLDGVADRRSKEKDQRFLAFAAVILLAGGILLPPAEAAAKSCPNFYNEGDLWQNVSHESVEKAVQSRYNGDWSKLLKNWEGVLEKVSQAKRQKKGYWITKDLFVESRGLGHHIDVFKWQISVARCLAG